MNRVPRYSRPDPLKDPEGYDRWVKECWLEGQSPVPEPEPACEVEGQQDSSNPEFPLIEDAYTISTPAKKWFVVFISPQATTPERVRKFCQRRGVQSYWPRRVRVMTLGRGKRRRQVAKVDPLMPRYALVHLHAERPPFGVLTAQEGRMNGICGFLGTALSPVSVSDDLVELMVQRERSGEFNTTTRKRGKVLTKLPDYMFLGNLVRVSDGPFETLPGVIEEIDEPRSRVKVSVSIFGRATPVELELAQIAEMRYG